MLPVMRQILLNNGIVKNGLIAWYDFTDPAGSQVLTDRSGIGNHGQNGSDTGIDTNDVTFDGVKATFGGDDYIVLPTLLPSNGDFTILTVAKSAGSGQDLFSQWSAGDAGRLTVSNYLGNLSFSFGGTIRLTGSLVIHNMVICGVLSRVNNEFFLYQNDRLIGTYATSAPVAQIATKLGTYGAGEYLVGSEYVTLVYNRGLSFSEIRKNCKYFKSILAKRGVIFG